MHEEPTAYRLPDPGVRALFAEDSRYQAWLDVEAALAQAQAELGIIPRTPPRRSPGRRGSRSWTGRPSGRGSSAPATRSCR